MNIEINEINKVNKDLIPTLLEVYANNKATSLRNKLQKVNGRILVKLAENSLSLSLSTPKYMQKTSIHIKNDVSSTVREIEDVFNFYEIKVMMEDVYNGVM